LCSHQAPPSSGYRIEKRQAILWSFDLTSSNQLKEELEMIVVYRLKKPNLQDAEEP
jgi:hypothetical protein